MVMVADSSEADTPARILIAAERLFREIGYQKTTVADIAKVLRMSPANVYRFFDSKRSIHEAVARRLMGEVETAATAIAFEDLEPVARLRRLLASIHHLNAERYTGDEKIHQMVAMAMEENWQVCNAHFERLTGIIGKVIDDGARAGVFDAPDLALAAMSTATAMSRFFHPQMIAQCADKPGPSLEQMIDFVIAALTPRHSA
ncbi:TetR family transcriptional regulator [Bradyrhizobium sp. U87765 SZCCT0131]|uniref:TetR/AcrR family transcriptional regulator n=1 Tax=unclassified Bradyrhizobium TaxID=2631580 RepID=UPI001BA95ABE|nr:MULTISPECIES: TetR family transcriptional regulator [unclassified Bradyrhizobium]MBR1218250.1 TetR family transcriptional regulator [Bradyrhizobium sp. U87765 SZCCT0131]MBR1260804.1 TetR family transcriptional regulator [Bradyrhizobium sp. U87765 SZCCT0134]MBR1303748.1 TetR family transcriptional regulator [Bradyrhizobium sp. U87765 SZCCT0110]MBR1319354.1 TetR family transcriptional regulator [Bradyrhizobium sp. U87765 SZCCT0109]MBR1347679.1 TetR family transcriptional regulator [Bradyrhizo